MEQAAGAHRRDAGLRPGCQEGPGLCAALAQRAAARQQLEVAAVHGLHGGLGPQKRRRGARQVQNALASELFKGLRATRRHRSLTTPWYMLRGPLRLQSKQDQVSSQTHHCV